MLSWKAISVAAERKSLTVQDTLQGLNQERHKRLCITLEENICSSQLTLSLARCLSALFLSICLSETVASWQTDGAIVASPQSLPYQRSATQVRLNMERHQISQLFPTAK